MFGIEPIGLSSFKCTPRLPEDWAFMKLNNIKAFQTSFGIEVFRKKTAYEIVITQNDKIIQRKSWNGKNEVVINLED